MNAQHAQGLLRYWSCKVDSASGMTDYVQFATATEHVFRAPLRYITEQDARRLVACWNACEGISTDVLELETPSIKSVRLSGFWAESLLKQRDRLLAALNAIKEESTDPGAVECARAAITEVKGIR